MLKTNLCNYSNAYIRVKETITIPNTRAAAATSIRNMKVIFNKPAKPAAPNSNNNNNNNNNNNVFFKFKEKI